MPLLEELLGLPPLFDPANRRASAFDGPTLPDYMLHGLPPLSFGSLTPDTLDSRWAAAPRGAQATASGAFYQPDRSPNPYGWSTVPGGGSPSRDVCTHAP